MAQYPTFDPADCTTCGMPVPYPFRRYENGELVHGCIDAHHDNFADWWHLRPEAIAVRERIAERLAS